MKDSRQVSASEVGYTFSLERVFLTKVKNDNEGYLWGAALCLQLLKIRVK